MEKILLKELRIIALIVVSRLKEKAIDAVVVQQKTNGKERAQKHEVLPSNC